MLKKLLLVLILNCALCLPLSVSAATASPHYVIVVDNSASMNTTKTRRIVLDFIGSLSTRLKEGDRVSLITSGSAAQIVFDQVVKSNSVGKNLFEGAGLFSLSETYTDISGDFRYLLAFLLSEQQHQHQTLVFFLTDGLLDIVTHKSATLPQKFVRNPQYQKLLEEYSPDINENVVSDGKIVTFNNTTKDYWKQVLAEEISPALKKRNTPFFILSFADDVPLLHDFSQILSLEGGMKNYHVIVSSADSETFLNSLENYVTDLPTTPKEKEITEDTTPLVDSVVEEVVETSSDKAKINEKSSPLVFIILFVFGVAGVLFFMKNSKGNSEGKDTPKGDDKESPVAAKEEKLEENKEEEPLSEEEKAQRVKTLMKIHELDKLREELRMVDGVEPSPQSFNKVADRENRQNYRYPIPSAFPLTYRFYTKEINITGKLHDISEEGCGLTILDPGYYIGPLDNVIGTFEINYQGRVIELSSVLVTHGLSSAERFGVSMKGLTQFPEVRLLWLETMIEIITELKKKRVWR